MSDATDRDVAFHELIRLVRPNSAPTLTAEELEDALDANKRGQRWAANTTLALGVVVVPTTRMGRVFRVAQAGTTGPTEPIWPTGEDDAVVDGTVTLVEAGVDFANIYNIRAAEEECWALKERKAVALTVSGDAGFNHVAEQCREQRKSLASVLIA